MSLKIGSEDSYAWHGDELSRQRRSEMPGDWN